MFYVRESSWSDGLPLTAADCEDAWRRVIDPQTGSRRACLRALDVCGQI